PARLTRAEGRKFGFTLAPAFLVFAGLLIWRGRPLLASIAGGIGLLLAAGALVVPERLGPLERGWMAFAHAISRVTTPIILGVVWFLVLTPTGLLRRAFGGNPLVHTTEDGGFWISRGPDGEKSDLRRQF
ncbi:MAG TPA: SxtJ family membrane protein, partial [Longimicrobiales bacterium]|nr:SxtJ family membrane protein [Longimicrobiales bacterium]